jgi:glycosyltransferase involved in cell wall biosynthesis
MRSRAQPATTPSLVHSRQSGSQQQSDSLLRVPAAKPLRIAWLGPTPGGYAGVRGVAAELLGGLARGGHQIDCFFPAAEDQTHVRIAGDEQVTFGEGNLAFGENVTFIWGTSRWQWNRWYSRGKVAAFASGMLARGVASVRLRREIARRHRREPYDLVYQFSNIETPGLPPSVARAVPLVIHPETHIAGELRWLIAERRLCLRCQPSYIFVIVATIMCVRALVQRRAIRRASLLICISSVFRDHLVHDYGFPLRKTLVVPNPMRAERFSSTPDRVGDGPPTILVLGRISTRKGVEDVVAVAQVLLERGIEVRVRVVGGPSLWSDYTRLLDDLPANAEYAGHMSAAEIPAELARTDVLLQASKYEPFGLTVAEALAAGVPVVATSEVGAIEGVDRAAAAEVAPGDVESMATAISEMLAALERKPTELRALARAEAERLFAPEVICEQISAALERLVDSVV